MDNQPTDEYQKRVQALIKKIQIVAFIIAAIIVVVVVYNSIHKEEISEEVQFEEQLEEQLEGRESEQVKEQEEEVEEEVSPEEVTPSVKIESASVTFKKRDAIYPDQYFCKVEMSGTATLRPVPATGLGFAGCNEEPCIFGKNADVNIANYIDSTLTCPSWTNEYGSKCQRRSGQPATGEWGLTFFDSFYPWEGHKRTFYVYTTTKTDWVWDSVTLTCSP